MDAAGELDTSKAARSCSKDIRNIKGSNASQACIVRKMKLRPLPSICKASQRSGRLGKKKVQHQNKTFDHFLKINKGGKAAALHALHASNNRGLSDATNKGYGHKATPEKEGSDRESKESLDCLTFLMRSKVIFSWCCVCMCERERVRERERYDFKTPVERVSFGFL